MFASRVATLLIGVVGILLGPVPPAAEPPVRMVNGTDEQQLRMMEAVGRFHSIGLTLPPLTVTFYDDESSCSGHLGLFGEGEISICTDLDFIYEHELAHAWERANLDESTRQAFMDLRGHDNWLDPAKSWNERGGEDAAFIIQQGLLATPLPSNLSGEFEQRLEAFELLTGVPSPREQL